MYNNNGLSNEKVKENRKKYGANTINGKNKNTFLNLFIETLGDPIIKILIIALAVKTIFLFKDFDYFETIGITVAILIAALISAISEYGSNKAFERMQEESSKTNIRVRREGKVSEVKIDEIVKEDIILLSSGEKIPADGIIIRGMLSIDSSSLNGETKEEYKEHINDITKAKEKNKVYKGTTIYDGDAEVLVTKVGMDTLYGKMASELTTKEDSSPLKQRLTILAKTISKIGYIAAILIAISYLFSKIFILNNFDLSIIKSISLNTYIGYLLEAMTLAVSVLVMSVPEGLPMMITLVLSTNAKKMLKDNVLVRKMVGIETAGSLNILFTDKTGTLTNGKMKVESIMVGSGIKYKDKDNIPKNYKQIITDSIIYNNDSILDDITNKVLGGNQTDKSLLTFINQRKNKEIKIIDKIQFNSKNKYSISVIEKNNEKLKLIKGAPDKILNFTDNYIDIDGKCKKINKEKIKNQIAKETNEGKRAIFLAISHSIYPLDNLRRNTLVGIVFIKDEVRSEAKDGISLISKAGVDIIMVTGDSKNTAKRIAIEVGIVRSDSNIILSSEELKKLTDDEIKKILPNLKVVARALPEDKKRLVTLAKELGLITGMTGDGTNDTIALKKADVAFSMGSGTEVAKDASDIVILDDNIISISKAILYGRTIFKNIRKFIIFQLSVNISAVSLALIGPFIGVPSPITVIQMLWINMVMDTLAGLAFSYEVPKVEYMYEPPKKKEENILNKYMINEIIISGLYSLILCIIFLKLPIIKNLFINNNHFMTSFFCLFIFLATFNAFNARTHRLNIFSHIKENKPFIIIIIFIIIVQISIVYSGITIFQTTKITPKEMLIVLLLSITIIPIDLIRKILIKKISNNNFQRV